MPDLEAGQPHPNIIEQGISHEQLVQSFRSLIRDHQALYQHIHSIGENPHESDAISSETAVRGVLDWYAGSANTEMGEQLVYGYPLKAGQLGYDCRYSTMHGMPVTGGRGFRGLKPWWYNSVPP
jgi:hypothetical protein